VLIEKRWKMGDLFRLRFQLPTPLFELRRDKTTRQVELRPDNSLRIGTDPERRILNHSAMVNRQLCLLGYMV
jgi:hypothetical protein